MELNKRSESKSGISTRSSSSKGAQKIDDHEKISIRSSILSRSSSKAEPVADGVEKISEPSSSQSQNSHSSLGSIHKGDLFWSQIGSYPYWPCIVTPDPDNQEIATRLSHFGRSYEAYHVRFFGDKGSRSWIKKSKLIAYEGRNKFDDKIKSLKSKNSKRLHKKGLRNKFWNTAIEEADLVKSCRPEERLKKFEDILESSNKFANQSTKISRKRPLKKN